MSLTKFGSESERPLQRRESYIAVPSPSPVKSGAVCAVNPSPLLREHERAASRTPSFTVVLFMSAARRIEELSSPLGIDNVEVRHEDRSPTFEALRRSRVGNSTRPCVPELVQASVLGHCARLLLADLVTHAESDVSRKSGHR